MLLWLQVYGQNILFILFIGSLLALLLFTLIAHPKVTCCATSDSRTGNNGKRAR